MAKDKDSDKGKSRDKKKPKKNQQHDDLLGNAAKSLKKFRKVTRNVTKLTTGQKVVGGIALLAAGLTYLAKKQSQSPQPAADTPDAQAAEAHLTALTSPEDTGGEFSPPPPAAAPARPTPAAKKNRKGR
ncbi:hypothetical protein [Hymenobacter metallicola]|uniref:Uncharacterized protein n=1 Tax=Hymenobacter metallicola TaxID=2563114 RepID=A0A4Z0QCH8_9BACT|nr:hypothetical protein [Hymenobacter metallicola]TGE27435.1 hypothetical protein E5K02_13740 [Hymenobacter metallicola]